MKSIYVQCQWTSLDGCHAQVDDKRWYSLLEPTLKSGICRLLFKFLEIRRILDFGVSAFRGVRCCLKNRNLC